MSGRYDWDAIRHAYESGSDVHTLVSLHGLRPDTLRRKARDQGWQRRPTDTSPTTTPTATTTAGMLTTATATTQTATATAPTVSAVTTTTPPTATPGIPAETMRTRAVTREDILRRHKDEWTRHAELVDAALDDSDIELAKLAKVLAETMRIRQDGERRAWGINDKTDTDLSGPMTISWRSPA